jgi:peptidoglycan/xylan/chitin deacetylase (PgdA/CDA1 family)
VEIKEAVKDHGRLLVCFDFEGSYGMPHDEPYDVEKGARVILEELASHEARAVFFVVGRMIEEHPQIVQDLAAAGHEIGLHGYEHDDMSGYDTDALARMGDNLARVGDRLEALTGARPHCFRAPYLLAPHFYRQDIYALLKALGYRWVSNREVRYPVELFRPGLLPVQDAWRRISDGAPRMARSRLMLAPLNAGLVAKETFAGSPVGRLRWLLGHRPPFIRDGLVEVPVYSPLDCDLIGLPTPEADTSPQALAYASAVVKAAIAGPDPLTMITFHDWIVSGGNRPALLRDALASARARGMAISTIAANPDWLPSLA